MDFAKLRRTQGKPLNWFMSRLLSGERPVRIDARIHSSGGTATVEVERVLVSGMALTGGMLEYLVRNVLWSYYPQAQAGKPFELSNRIERLEVQPSEVRVVIAEAPAGWRRLATPAVAVPPGR